MANNLTVTYKGSTIHTASASGSATLETGGTWCEDDIGLSYTFDAAKATLAVAVTNGTATSVTATKSGVSVSLTYSGGIWSAELPSYGAWTVTITDGTHSNSATVNASTAGLYTVSIFMPDVPIGYTQLEWMAGAINSGYEPVSDCRVFTKFQPTEIVANGVRPFRAFTSSNQRIGLDVSSYSGNPFVYYNGTPPSSAAVFISNASADIVYEVSTKNRSITINGTTYTVTGGSAITTPYSVAFQLGVRSKMFYFKATAPDEVTFVRDMVAARRDSDSYIGMYDKITGEFYTNENQSAMTAGPAV